LLDALHALHLGLWSSEILRLEFIKFRMTQFPPPYSNVVPRWRSWLRHCATNRKVAGSIPDGVSGFFSIDIILSVLGSTQPLTEMSTRNISWGVNAYGWQPTTFKCRLSRNLGASTSWNPVGLSRPVMGLLYLLFFFYLTLLWGTFSICPAVNTLSSAPCSEAPSAFFLQLTHFPQHPALRHLQHVSCS
jgi:hypothetical protein